MIKQISFKNYKIFKKKQTLELRPITILIGKNNTGKSAVLKLPTMIEGALNSLDVQPIQLINDGVAMGNDYIDLVYGKFGKALEIELLQFNKKTETDDRLISEIIIDNDQNKPLIDYWKFNNELELQRTQKNHYYNEVDEVEYNCEFNGLYLSTYFNIEKESSGTIFEQQFSLKTDFIGGLRQKANKYYDYIPSKINKNFKSNIDGSNLYNFLIEDYLATDKKYYNQINSFLNSKFEGWDLHIKTDNKPYPIELHKGDLRINLTETGMGIGQSLPLIIRAVKPCTEETLIIIEEPESHLHPYAHAELAQLFADSLKMDANKNYLFETHSLNFVLRMRRLVAEGKLDKDDLAIYYIDFDEDANESNLVRILVDDCGGVDHWPEGVFSETTKETRAIYNAQLNDLGYVGRNK